MLDPVVRRLREVTVRATVGPSERNRWDALMGAHHYLPFRGLVGRSVRHVAVLGEHWLALIGWHAARTWAAQHACGAEPVAIDGKHIRGAARHNPGAKHLLVAAAEHRSGIVLGQEAVEHKSNEPPAVRTLLTALDRPAARDCTTAPTHRFARYALQAALFRQIFLRGTEKYSSQPSRMAHSSRYSRTPPKYNE